MENVAKTCPSGEGSCGNEEELKTLAEQLEKAQASFDAANQTHADVVAAVEWFESGINLKRPANIVKAFELVGRILSAAAGAIVECVKDAVALVTKIKGAAAALSGNVLAILKIVLDETIHIWQDRKELTDVLAKLHNSTWILDLHDLHAVFDR